jgi:hypothetical protein
MFYNVENLFDPEDNLLTQDDEFTPEGMRRWTKNRYYQKINKVGKVITSVGEWDYPALVGLCEIENEKVLNDLTNYSLLKKARYRYVVCQSEDVRGIRTALLYQPEYFKYISHDNIRIVLPDNRKTRDILHVTGVIMTRDTLDIFVCHYPSRRGGILESETYRVLTSLALKEKTDSIFSSRKEARIIIMGDFNDEPSDKSMSEILDAREISANIQDKELYNLFLSVEKKSQIGSYKYADRWNFLDQIIVSGNLLDGNKSFYVLPETARVFQSQAMMKEDMLHGGERPVKTYHGYKYEGGFSDHLPIVTDFKLMFSD